jgi:hypothetical protein
MSNNSIKALEEEMIKLEDEIDIASIAIMIAPRGEEGAWKTKKVSLVTKRDAVKEERRKLKANTK